MEPNGTTEWLKPKDRAFHARLSLGESELLLEQELEQLSTEELKRLIDEGSAAPTDEHTAKIISLIEKYDEEEEEFEIDELEELEQLRYELDKIQEELRLEREIKQFEQRLRAMSTWELNNLLDQMESGKRWKRQRNKIRVNRELPGNADDKSASSSGNNQKNDSNDALEEGPEEMVDDGEAIPGGLLENLSAGVTNMLKSILDERFKADAQNQTGQGEEDKKTGKKKKHRKEKSDKKEKKEKKEKKRKERKKAIKDESRKERRDKKKGSFSAVSFLSFPLPLMAISAEKMEEMDNWLFGDSIKEGWLYRRKAKKQFRVWKRRWCVLSKGQMSLYNPKKILKEKWDVMFVTAQKKKVMKLSKKTSTRNSISLASSSSSSSSLSTGLSSSSSVAPGTAPATPSTSKQQSFYFFELMTRQELVRFCCPNEQEQDEWVTAINKERDANVNHMLMSSEDSNGAGKADSGLSDGHEKEENDGKLGIKESRRLLKEIIESDESDDLKETHEDEPDESIPDEALQWCSNSSCADCGSENPDWASINSGVFICLECSGVHRSMGVHISQVRSVVLDRWKMEDVLFIKSVGNKRYNTEWRKRLKALLESQKGQELKESFSTFTECNFTKLKALATAEQKKVYLTIKYTVGAAAGSSSSSVTPVNLASSRSDSSLFGLDKARGSTTPRAMNANRRTIADGCGLGLGYDSSKAKHDKIKPPNRKKSKSGFLKRQKSLGSSGMLEYCTDEPREARDKSSVEQHSDHKEIAQQQARGRRSNTTSCVMGPYGSSASTTTPSSPSPLHPKDKNYIARLKMM